MSSGKRIYSIDLLRFIAAFYVMMFHYAFRGSIVGNTTLELNEISKYFKYGYFGVHLFFIISGFVILLSVQKNSVFDFIKSRVVRLYPAYWVCVCITFIVVYFFGNTFTSVGVYNWIVNMTMLNSFIGIPSVDGVYWSLHVELIFYFLIIIYLILKKKFTKLKDDHLIIVWLLISLSQLVIDYDSHYFLKLIRFVFIFKYSSFFIAGMLFFKIYKTNLKMYKYLLFPTLGLSLYSCYLSINQMIIDYTTDYSFLICTLIIVSFYVVFYLIITGGLDVINKPIYMSIGLLTYPLYLIHQVFGEVVK